MASGPVISVVSNCPFLILFANSIPLNVVLLDETYVKIKGEWKYLYRAIDSTGQTIDFMLSAKRDARAAKRFFRKMLKVASHSSPRVINVDKNPAYRVLAGKKREKCKKGSLALASEGRAA
jgi:transposase-like protein